MFFQKYFVHKFEFDFFLFYFGNSYNLDKHFVKIFFNKNNLSKDTLYLYTIKTITMKKIALLFLTISAIGFSQTKKLEKGTYKSKLSNEPIKLTVDESGNFNFVFLSGKLEYENDTIYFNRKSKELKSSFEIYEVDDKKMSANLKIDIDYNTKNYLDYNTYIAFQTTENAPLKYKPAAEYFGSFSENSFENEDKSETLEVEKAKYIYLVSVRSENPIVTKFEIPNGVNHIKLMRSASLKDLNLIGFFDHDNNLKITDGKSPVIFTLKTNDADEKQPLKPLEIYAENNFYTKYGIQENNADVIEAIDSTATVVVEEYEGNYYDFKLKKFNSYKEALADTKDNKYLILIKSTDKTYNAITENYQNDTKYSMYGGYDESKDNFNFYQATEKDKKLYNQYLKKEGIIVYNKDGDVLYYKEINLAEENPANNYTFLTELEKANYASQIDRVIANKKATTDDLKKAFTKPNLRKKYYTEYDAQKIVEVAPPPPPPAPTIGGRETIAVEETAKKAVEAAAEAVKEAAKTTATTVELPEESVNFYKIKSSQDVVYDKWYSIVNESSTKPLDTLLLPAYKNAITNSAFIDNYFKKETINKNDLKIVDYLQKNYAKIKEHEDASTDMYYDEKTINCLTGFYGNHLDMENNPLSNEILDRYQYFAENINTSPSTFGNYLYALSNNKKDINFILNQYNNYFNRIIPSESNLIESLDKSFTNSDANDWIGYKTSFASLANNTAWKVVENRLTDDYLQKALHWSETSLQIEKNNSYYLDTLAQLYYLNGDREKAIITEQKAIDNINANNDYDNQKENYSNVLQKMKEGKY